MNPGWRVMISSSEGNTSLVIFERRRMVCANEPAEDTSHVLRTPLSAWRFG
ncbi:Uncharacterised protein [Mycobacteroides abscessus subsp. abscessus]|nr:Uncharacterised protein [Mycobacteroides abscessus subsp. abscessus]